jgi:hypothetical protein
VDSESRQRHPNYVGLNLVGYGLARFEGDLIAALGFDSKAALYRDLLARGLAKTRGTLKNRQDLFNPLVRGGRIGWWQNGERYLHRKTQLDGLFGRHDAAQYAIMLNKYLEAEFPEPGTRKQPLPPIMKSQFRQLQETGVEAEMFFLQNYRKVGLFAHAAIEDARQLGDGYDFQLTLGSAYWIAEVKGLRTRRGAIRLTQNEFDKATEFGGRFCLVVVMSLDKRPAMLPMFDPLPRLHLTRRTVVCEQVYYHTRVIEWNEPVA